MEERLRACQGCRENERLGDIAQELELARQEQAYLVEQASFEQL